MGNQEAAGAATEPQTIRLDEEQEVAAPAGSAEATAQAYTDGLEPRENRPWSAQLPRLPEARALEGLEQKVVHRKHVNIISEVLNVEEVERDPNSSQQATCAASEAHLQYPATHDNHEQEREAAAPKCAESHSSRDSWSLARHSRQYLLIAAAYMALLLLSRFAAQAGLPRLFVPDVEGADEAQAWLRMYRRQGQRGAEAARLWPESVALPSCNDTLENWTGRRHLILSQVGDSWGADATRNKWLDDPPFAAMFDIVVIYFGNNESWACPQCLKVFRDSGPKWQMTHRLLFSQEWQQLISDQDYGYVWMPDDDIIASACDIARFFDILESQQLFIAQMSVCPVEGTAIMWPHLLQRGGNALRYVAFVEIMASALRFDFFQAVVRSTLGQSWTGWGLDTLWPFLLGFPRDGLAVVDAVCMIHEGQAGKREDGSSNYDATEGSPWDSPRHEDRALLAQWRVWPDAIAAMGVPPDIGDRAAKEFRLVPLAVPPPASRFSLPSAPPRPPARGANADADASPPGASASQAAGAPVVASAANPLDSKTGALGGSPCPTGTSAASPSSACTADATHRAAAHPDPAAPAQRADASAWGSAAVAAAAASGWQADGSPPFLLAVGALLAVALAGSLAVMRAMRGRCQRRRAAAPCTYLLVGPSVQPVRLLDAACV